MAVRAMASAAIMFRFPDARNDRILRRQMVFLFFTFINGLQPVSSNFFTSIGKAAKGIFLSLTRQIIFLLPLIIILPMFMGIDGVMYSAPVADFMAAVLVIIFITREMRLLNRMIDKEGVLS